MMSSDLKAKRASSVEFEGGGGVSDGRIESKNPALQQVVSNLAGSIFDFLTSEIDRMHQINTVLGVNGKKQVYHFLFRDKTKKECSTLNRINISCRIKALAPENYKTNSQEGWFASLLRGDLPENEVPSLQPRSSMHHCIANSLQTLLEISGKVWEQNHPQYRLNLKVKPFVYNIDKLFWTEKSKLGPAGIHVSWQERSV